MIRQTLLAWTAGLVALAAAGAGVASLTGGSGVTSLVRMGVVAWVLGAYAAAVAIVVTRRSARSWARCLLWGATVPTAVGLVNAALVSATVEAASGAVTAVPWILGALVVASVGPLLPGLRWPDRWRRARETG